MANSPHLNIAVVTKKSAFLRIVQVRYYRKATDLCISTRPGTLIQSFDAYSLLVQMMTVA